MAICRIVRAIFHNDNSVLTVSARLRGAYGLKKDVFIGTPCVINSGGVKRVLELKLEPEELEKFMRSYDILSESFDSIQL